MDKKKTAGNSCSSLWRRSGYRRHLVLVASGWRRIRYPSAGLSGLNTLFPFACKVPPPDPV